MKDPLSGFLLEGVAAAGAGYADAAFAAGDSDDFLAAGAAEERVFTALAEAVAEEAERACEAVAGGEIFPVFLSAARIVSRKNADIHQNDQHERRRGEDHAERFALSAQGDGEQNAHARAHGQEPSECIRTVTTVHERRKTRTAPHRIEPPGS